MHLSLRSVVFKHECPFIDLSFRAEFIMIVKLRCFCFMFRLPLSLSVLPKKSDFLSTMEAVL